MTAPVLQIRPDPRPAVRPSRSAATGTIAAGIGQAATAAIVSANPELAPVAPIIGTAITGVLNGLGNAARNRVASGRPGPGMLFAMLFEWLG